jgi:hypothetical protein
LHGHWLVGSRQLNILFTDKFRTFQPFYLLARTMQRNPMWLVEVSTVSPWRAAGR